MRESKPLQVVSWDSSELCIFQCGVKNSLEDLEADMDLSPRECLRKEKKMGGQLASGMAA